MKIIEYPGKKSWNSLVKRPLQESKAIDSAVSDIIEEVKRRGDQALKDYNREFDNSTPDNLLVSKEEIKEAAARVDKNLKLSIETAAANIYAFHSSQLRKTEPIETTKGVYCWQESRAIEKVGLYIPGGTAPLFSTVLMLAIPAQIAKCDEVILCTPPGPEGKIDPAILYTASLCGVDRIYKTGGAQAIAAMAYGTETIPEVFKIFGPGNQYVTRAKEMVQLDGLAIDMPAGPSEVLIIADKSSEPAFIAADLLSQAEHGSDSQVVLLSDSASLVSETFREVEKQLQELPRADIAREALQNSFAVLLSDINTCLEFSNLYAPEHLILAVSGYKSFIESVKSAGSVFLGSYSCESAGDYASGTNHTLPTNGFARAYSGVSTDSFLKKISFQEITRTGLQNIGPAIEIMAGNEQLDAHKNAVSIRLKSLKDD